MDPRFSVYIPSSTWYNPGIYQTYQSSECVSERTQAIQLIRQERRKMPPILPDPDYMPVFPKDKYYKRIIQKIRPPLVITCNKNVRPEPYKKKRQVDNRNDLHNLLGANTSSLPIDSFSQDIKSHSTKSHLLQSITKVDGEISTIHYEIVKRIKKQKELEKAANKSSLNDQEKVLQPAAHCNLFQKIFAENRQKALEAHNILANLGPKVDSPLHSQPFDPDVNHENKMKSLDFKVKLLRSMKTKLRGRIKSQKPLFRLNSSVACNWKNDVKVIENSQEYKTREVEKRIYFETIFPELQKKKYGRGRSKRTGDCVRNEVDSEEILCKSQLENLEEKMRNVCASIPPLLDAEQRSKLCNNENNEIKDMATYKKEKESLNVWTEKEKRVFKEKFIQHSKNFRIISSFLDKKNICDCVKFYYCTKKSENYKQLIHKSRQKQLGCNSLKIFNE